MILIGLTPALHAQSDAAANNANTISSSEVARLKIPSPVEEVVQLSKSGVGDAVVVNYIKNSDRSYQLGARDIINLHNEGISPAVTTAMIQRGAEQRQAAADAAKTAKPAETETSAAPTYQTQPTPTVVAAPVTYTYYEPVVPTSTVSVHYFGSRPYNNYYRPYYYPSYRYYSPSYYCGPRVSVGYGYGGYRGGYYRAGARYCR